MAVICAPVLEVANRRPAGRAQKGLTASPGVTYYFVITLKQAVMRPVVKQDSCRAGDTLESLQLPMANLHVPIVSALRRSLAPALLLMIPAAAAFAQDNNNPAAGIAGCAACSFGLAIPIVILALDVLLLVWVARDAKARGLDNGILWMLLVFFTSFVGLIIYLLARPQGNLVECPNCHNKKLQAAVRCPHCGV